MSENPYVRTGRAYKDMCERAERAEAEVERLRGALTIIVAVPEHAREYAEAALAWRRKEPR